METADVTWWKGCLNEDCCLKTAVVYSCMFAYSDCLFRNASNNRHDKCHNQNNKGETE